MNRDDPLLAWKFLLVLAIVAFTLETCIGNAVEKEPVFFKQ